MLSWKLKNNVCYFIQKFFDLALQQNMLLSGDYLKTDPYRHKTSSVSQNSLHYLHCWQSLEPESICNIDLPVRVNKDFLA